MNGLYKTGGLVLRTRNLGEADKIVTLYTKKRGKIEAVARGSRRIRNRLLGSTQVFTYGQYLIFEGRSLDTIAQGEIVFSFQSLRDDLEKMAAAMYICELVDVFTEVDVPNDATFTLIYNTLRMIDERQIKFALRTFELIFIKQLGYQPQLSTCLNCGNTVENDVYFSREGGIVCHNCRAKMAPVRKLNKGTLELIKRILEWDWSRIGILHPSDQSLAELELCMRDYLDYRLDRPLRSLEFIHTLKEFDHSEVKD
ncbi:MAG: DNA repair protein RecO [Firmicutes bacterium]|nr:DNA repair protein RecO [Bacillota bacterium]